MRRKPYREGDWFAVPLDNGYVLGRIARVGKRGGILLGYFFEPLRKSVPSIEDTLNLTAHDAFKIGKFGDRGLVEDNWPIIPHLDNWDRSEWPMPLLGRLDIFTRDRGHAIQYDESELSLCIREIPITFEQVIKLPRDGLAGHIYLQGISEKYFREGQPPFNPDERKKVYTWFQGLPKAE